MAKTVTVAVLGTGLMGAPMAQNLARAGYAVRAWNRSPDKALALASGGVVPVARIADAVQGADVVIVMVSNDSAADAVLLGSGEGPNGDTVLDHAAAGTTVIVMSSISVEAARHQSRALTARGLAYVDAPVSGGEKGAIEGTLSIMAGGEPSAIDAVRPVLDVLGRVTRVGGVGTGQLAKIANQAIVGITIAAVAEALALVRAGGGDMAAVREALLGGFADSTILRQLGARMIEGNFKPGAHATTQLKDLGLGTDLAEHYGLDLSTLNHVQSLYQSMCADGHGDLDHSGLFEWLRRRSPQG